MGCTQHASKTEVPEPKITQIPGPPAPDTTKLHADLIGVQAHIDSLLPHFAFKQQNLPLSSYYHKNWYERYYVHGNALIAGVDSLGRFFLIDIYNCTAGTRWEEDFRVHKSEDCDSARSWMELRLPDTTVRIYREPSLPAQLWPGRKSPIERDLVISTGYFCSDYYPILDNEWLLQRLADPNLKAYKHYRRCDGRGVGDLDHVGRKSREGIADCVKLSNAIQRKALLEAELSLARLEMGIVTPD